METYQRDNVERACNRVIREALSYGLGANDLKKILAYCWEQELQMMAELGAKEILS